MNSINSCESIQRCGSSHQTVARRCACISVCTHAKTHTHTHIHTYTRTHTHTHKHIHTPQIYDAKNFQRSKNDVSIRQHTLEAAPRDCYCLCKLHTSAYISISAYCIRQHTSAYAGGQCLCKLHTSAYVTRLLLPLHTAYGSIASASCIRQHTYVYTHIYRHIHTYIDINICIYIYI